MTDLKCIESRWLGLIDYPDGLTEQNQAHIMIAKSVVEGAEKAIVLGCEHTATITLGRRSQAESEILQFDESVHVANTDRGGQATLHSPGQLVIYPIVPIRPLGIGVRDYICWLIKCTKSILSDCGVTSYQRSDEPGLYTDTGKIAFFGIRVHRGITMHGLSINISNQLADFAMIRSCGIQGEAFDSLSNYQPAVGTQEIFDQWCDRFESLAPTSTGYRPIDRE